jgi:carbon starvation protein
MMIPAMWVMIAVLAILAIAYRYYSGFLAARLVGLDNSRATPAHTRRDGQNYDPTNRWVLFGHHFAAISGAGPLIGPVLAIQFGYLPGLIWLVIGVCLAGAVQDFLVLSLSTRRDGLSLANLAKKEIGPLASAVTALAILYVIVIALAGLGIVVVKALGGEEVDLPAQSTLVLSRRATVQNTLDVAKQIRTYAVPPGSDFRYNPADPEQSHHISEGFTLRVPGADHAKVGTLRQADGEDRTTLKLPDGAKRIVPGSAWGTFTIACTIPIALLVGMYMYRIRPGKVVEASIIGAAGVLAATFVGAWIPNSPLGPWFSWSAARTTYAIAVYGFIAAILPVWLLLCPRDYLSSFLKIGTIALLVAGVIVANPTLKAPTVNPVFSGGGGPYFKGAIFPYVFICIMCGAISGFHSLVASGTTPKMLDRETDARPIGYGAMLMEGLVGVVALVAAASLPSSMYYDINIDLAQQPEYARKLEPLLDHEPQGEGGAALVQMEQEVGESLHGRTGGAVTLAVGMARILTDAVPGASWLIKYWYHFAIMFEALFILTTIDAGTRIGRFMLQEFLGRLWKPLGNLDWLPASMFATGLIVFAWAYFILTNSVATIWPMFGMANQLLALIALVVVTSALVNAGKLRYAVVSLAPAAFVACTTFSAAYQEITRTYWGKWVQGGEPIKGWLNIGLTLMLLGCVLVLIVSALVRWNRVLRSRSFGPAYGVSP